MLDRKKKSAKWDFLAKVDVLGSLDFWTLTVGFDSLSENDIHGLDVRNTIFSSNTKCDMAEYEQRKKVLPLAAHEYTHFIDSTSTVWGMRHLRNLDACIGTPLDNEKEFFKLKRTHDYMRCIRLPEYYTVVEKGVTSQRPWHSESTVGILFKWDGSLSQRQILFVRFYNADGQAMVRSPISMVSLLEASAMAKEIDVRMHLIDQLPDDQKVVERKLFSDEILDHLYHPELTEYSVCFHLLANIQNSADIARTASMVGFMVRLVLNMPPISFEVASKHVKVFLKLTDLPEDCVEGERLKAALEQMNHGAMFFLLSVLLPKDSSRNRKTFLVNVERTLRTIGLGLEKIRRAALDDVQSSFDALQNSSSSYMKAIAAAGRTNFDLTFRHVMEYPLQMFSLPPAELGDLTPYKFSNESENQLKDYDIGHGYESLVQGQLKAENFAEACI